MMQMLTAEVIPMRAGRNYRIKRLILERQTEAIFTASNGKRFCRNSVRNRKQRYKIANNPNFRLGLFASHKERVTRKSAKKFLKNNAKKQLKNTKIKKKEFVEIIVWRQLFE
jgi:hypothetical protein